MRIVGIAIILLAALGSAAAGAQGKAACGAVHSVAAHDGTSMRYALHLPRDPPSERTVLVLLPGGGGFLDLDAGGCPRQLNGNSLVRSLSLFVGAGFTVALVDAPSDHRGEDGLADFRTSPKHAADLGRLVADLRQGGPATVWLVGTSRGSISAANAAAHLKDAEAPDGVILTSALMAGQAGARKLFVTQSVFDLTLENIRQPVLILGHAADQCPRSPPALMSRLAEKLSAASVQVAVMEGGPGGSGSAGLDACEGRSPHGFIGQDAEMAAGIIRFIRTGRY